MIFVIVVFLVAKTSWASWLNSLHSLPADPIWIHNGSMAVTLSVKNVPNDLARRLKARAARNHRSLQGELRAILEEAAQVTSVTELVTLARQLGVKGTAGDSAASVRADRDGRSR